MWFKSSHNDSVSSSMCFADHCAMTSAMFETPSDKMHTMSFDDPWAAQRSEGTIHEAPSSVVSKPVPRMFWAPCRNCSSH